MCVFSLTRLTRLHRHPSQTYDINIFLKLKQERSPHKYTSTPGVDDSEVELSKETIRLVMVELERLGFLKVDIKYNFNILFDMLDLDRLVPI